MHTESIAWNIAQTTSLSVCVCQSTRYVASSAKLCILSEKRSIGIRQCGTSQFWISHARTHPMAKWTKNSMDIMNIFLLRWCLMLNKLATVPISSAQHASIHFYSCNWMFFFAFCKDVKRTHLFLPQRLIWLCAPFFLFKLKITAASNGNWITADVKIATLFDRYTRTFKCGVCENAKYA